MADPFTLMLIGTTVLAAGGQFMGGMQQAGQTQQAADIAGYNAQVAAAQARNAARVGAANEAAQRRKNADIIGQQAAALAEANIGGASAGSGYDVIRQNQAQLELDALNTRYQGLLNRTALNQQSRMYSFESNQLNQQASQQKLGAYLGAGTALLGGASKYTQQTGNYPFASLFQ